MTKELLKKISFQQTQRFFFSYSPNWRLTQILTIRRLLQERFIFFDDIITEIKDPDSVSNKAIIAQETTNGLYFEGIAIAIQSIEDLFALLNAGQKPLKFISGIINYGAGKVDQLLKQKHTQEDVASMFYFPLFDDVYDTEEVAKAFEQGFEFLYKTVLELKDFYNRFRFFYTQYKHGITVALRPYGDYTEKQVEEKEENYESAYLHVFDNLSVKKLKPTDVRFNNKVFMPYLTPDIAANWNQLLEEDNLIRFVTQDARIMIDDLIMVVRKSRMCTACFGNNLVSSLQEEYPITLQLPLNTSNEACIFSFPKEVYHLAKNKSIFIQPMH